jgi:hypothetical protein
MEICIHYIIKLLAVVCRPLLGYPLHAFDFGSSDLFIQIYHLFLFLDAFAKLRKATFSFVMPVSFCLSVWNNSASTGQIFMRFDI